MSQNENDEGAKIEEDDDENESTLMMGEWEK